MKDKFMKLMAERKHELLKVGSAILGALVGVAVVTIIENQTAEENLKGEPEPF